MEAKIYNISSTFARSKDIPRTFAAIILKETAKALHLYGHGAMDPEGGCSRCGRRLTHPGSILIGIGPECLKDWGARDIVLDSMTEDQKSYLKNLMEDKKVDCWIPKACIRSEFSSDEVIQAPQAPQQDVVKTNPISEHPKLEEPMKKVIPGPGEKFISIAFSYNKDLVESVRTLEGRRWDSIKKIWTAWRSIENLKNLQDWGFSLDPSLEKDLQKDSETFEEKVQSDTKLTEEIRQALLNAGVYPYQVEGISWLNAVNGNGLLGDEQGLGKTLQALYFLKLNPEIRPAAIVVPASLKINWERESLKWIGKDAKTVILKGKKPNKKDLKGKNIYIVNYDILSVWGPVLAEAGIQILIGDEIQKLQNPKTQQTKAFQELAKSCKRVIGLSGTPITSRPSQFFTFLNILDPINFNSWIRYVKRYCGAYHDGYGWNVSGATNLPELFEKINGKLMLRRKKEDVLKDLPEKRHIVVPMDINNRSEYNRAQEDLIQWVSEKFGKAKAEKTSSAEAITKFNYLKQLAADGKMDFAISWISDFLDSNGKLVVFCDHLAVIDRLMENLRNYNPVKVDGRCNAKNRQEAVDRFQQDESCRVFIGNAAAETGLTLTEASNVLHIEFPWTPASIDQRTDRIHRIGQTADSVSVWYLVAAETVEEEIVELIDKKRGTLTAVLDGKEVPEESLLTALIEKFSQK